MSRKTGVLVALVFVLQQASQVALTPLNEGMDYVGHLSYASFVASHARPPLPGELSLPAWISRVSDVVPGPDFTDGTRYQAWAQLTPPERIQQLDPVLAAPTDLRYSDANYESQQPPLYYWLIAVPYRLTSELALDSRTYVLGLVSILIASMALPAVYATLRLYVQDTSAVVGALSVAWFPNLMAFVGRISNDALAWPLIAWTMFVMARRSETPPAIICSGLLLGLAVLTKSYALTLVPVYLLSCGVIRAPTGHWMFSRPGAVLGLACTVLTIGPLVAFNYVIAGQPVLLTETLTTGNLPLSQRVLSLVRLDWPWFATGVVQGFWWSGYFSFVVRGFYYLPLLLPFTALLLGLARRPRQMWQAAGEGWVHVLAIGFFLAGLAWHAALTTLAASQLGATSHGGSEGWYLDVLVGSVCALGILLLRANLSDRRLAMVMVGTAGGLVIWNLLGRVILLLYWTGEVGPGATLSLGLPRALWATARSLPWDVGRGQLALPGAIGPALVTSVLPITIAMFLTAVILRRAVSVK